MSLSSPYTPGQWARAFGLIAAGMFFVCVLWSFFINDPGLQKLHMDLLRLVTLDIGGAEMSPVSFIAGLVISAIWGAVTGALLAMCLNHCHK